MNAEIDYERNTYIVEHNLPDTDYWKFLKIYLDSDNISYNFKYKQYLQFQSLNPHVTKECTFVLSKRKDFLTLTIYGNLKIKKEELIISKLSEAICIFFETIEFDFSEFKENLKNFIKLKNFES